MRVKPIGRWLAPLMIVLAACVVGAHAQPAAPLPQPAPTPVLVAADLREHQSLDGAWHWSIDPFRDGVAGFHGGPPGPSTRRWADIVQTEAAAKDPRALFEFDMQRSPVAYLPGS